MPLLRILKFFSFVLGGILALAIALILVAWGLVNTEPGRAWLAERVEDALSTPEARAEVSGLHGPLPQRIALDRLVMRDADGDWLTLEAAEVTWRPLALLRGRFEVEAVTAERVAVERIPEVEAVEEEPVVEPDEDPRDLGDLIPRLPVSVSLDHLLIERIELGEPVLGQAAVFRLEGQAAAPADAELRSNLRVDRLDAGEGHIALHAIFDRERDYLTLDGEVISEPDGLLAGFVDVPEMERVRITLDGEGPLEAWQGRLAGEMGDDVRLDLALGIEDAEFLTVTGQAAVAALLPPDAAELLGDPIDLDLHLRRVGDSGLDIEKAEVLTPTLRLALSGTVDGAEQHVDVTLDARLLDVEPINARAEPASLQGLELRVRAVGPLAAPAVELDGAASEVATPELAMERLEFAGGYSPRDRLTRGDLEISLNALGLTGEEPALDVLEDRALQATLSGLLELEDEPRLESFAAEVTTPGIRFTADGGVIFEGPEADAAFALTIDDLGRLEPVAEQPLQGRGAIDGHLTYNGSEQELRATVMGELDELVWPEPLAEALAGERVTLESEIAMDEAGGLRISRLDIAGRGVRVSGEASLPPDFSTIAADMQVDIPDLDLLSSALETPMAGSAQLRANVAGPLDDPAVEAALDVDDTVAADNPLGAVRLRARFEDVATAAQGSISLSLGESPIGPAEARVDVAMAEEVLQLSGLQAEAPGLRLSQGQFAIPLDGSPIDGGLELAITDAGEPAGRFDQDLAGEGAFSLTLAPGPEGEGQNVSLEGELREIFHAESEARVGAAVLSLSISDALSPDHQALATLEITSVEAGDVELGRVMLRAEGGMAGADVAMALEGDFFGPMSVDAAAEVSHEDAVTRVALNGLEISVQAMEIVLAQTAVFTVGPEVLAVEDFALMAEGGTLRLDARRTDQEIDATARIEDLPLALTRLVLAEPTLSGALQAEARLAGPLDAPEGSLSLAMDGVEVLDADLPTMAARFNAALAGGRLTMDGEFSGLSPTPVTLDASLPVALSLEPFAAEVDRDAPVEASVNWVGQMAHVMPLIPAAAEHDLRGRGEIALSLAGTLNDPRPEGHIALTGARYEHLTMGTLLTDLEIRLEGDEDLLRLTRLEARDGGQGRIEGEGTVELAEDVPTIDFNIEARRATLLRRDELTARTRADIAISGPFNDILVDGLITVERAEARMPEDMPPEIAHLDVVERAREEAAAELEEEAEVDAPAVETGEAPAQIRLDISVDVPSRFFVRGAGLDSEWAGNLVILGTANEPRVYGRIEVVRGQIDVIGRNFRLDRGVVSFDGSADVDPEIDIRAVHSADELEVSVLVTGRASQPEIELASVPEMPEEEILSRLLFGRGAADLSPLEAAQLGAAVAQLAVGGTGEGVMGRLRTAIGLDVLRIGEDAVMAGVYLREDLFVGVERGLAEGTGAVRVELGITDNISVESDLGADGRSEVGIQFKWDY